MWRAHVWQRPFLLVSSRALAVERDSLPLHLLNLDPSPVQRELVQLLGTQTDLWPAYSGWVATVYPALVEELTRMGRTKREDPAVNVGPLFQHLGWQEIVRQVGLQGLINEVGVERLVNEVGVERLINEVGVENVLAHLNAEQREEALRILQQPPRSEGRRRRQR